MRPRDPVETRERQAVRELRAALQNVIALTEAARPQPGLAAVRDYARRVLRETAGVQTAGTLLDYRRLGRRPDPQTLTTEGPQTPGADQPGRSLVG